MVSCTYDQQFYCGRPPSTQVCRKRPGKPGQGQWWYDGWLTPMVHLHSAFGTIAILAEESGKSPLERTVCVCVRARVTCHLFWAPVHTLHHPVQVGASAGIHKRSVTHEGKFCIAPPTSCGACLSLYREKGSAICFSRRLSCRVRVTNDIRLHFLLLQVSCDNKKIQFV